MAIGLGGHDTNSRALHQPTPAGNVGMALPAKQRIVEGGREARLSDRHLRLFATLSFDYQNRRRAGATELPLCRTLIGEVKICEKEMGEGNY